MIGSLEFENQTIEKDIFVPLVDGSLIRFKKDGFLEVSFEFNLNKAIQKTQYNVKDQNFPHFYNNNQCIVTGQVKTTAIQIDLNSGRIIQMVGADPSIFQGFERKHKYEFFQNTQSDQSAEEPIWLIMKNYDYLSYDHQNGLTQWSIFYSQFSSQSGSPSETSSQLMRSFKDPMTEVNDNKLYVRANMLTSLGASDLPKSSSDWSYLTDTPIFQLLKVNQERDRVEELPINFFLEKEPNSVRLVLIDNYTYADHSYKYLPSINTAIEKHNEKWPALIDSQYESMEAPLMEYHDPDLQEQKMIDYIQDQVIGGNKSYVQEEDSQQVLSISDTIFRIEFLMLIASLGFLQWVLIRKHYKSKQRDVELPNQAPVEPPIKNPEQQDQKEENGEKQVQLQTNKKKRSPKMKLKKNQDQQVKQLGPEPPQAQVQQSQQTELKEEEKQPPVEQRVTVQMIRKIKINEEKVLGLGSGGTVVFEGLLNDRTVAVKRMLLQHNKLARKEIQFLQKVDLHPNLITYYDKEECKDFIYLAVEKCEGNLENLVELMNIYRKNFKEWQHKPLAKMFTKKPSELVSPTQIRRIMWQALNAIQFLHENNIIHRDIKPHNILMNRLKDIKLSDMGLSKQLNDNQISYHTEVKGSLGWQPSEVISCEKIFADEAHMQKTTKVDIFSLGCVFYYLLSKGNHPFGKRVERESNILNGKFSTCQLEYSLVKDRYQEAVQLVQLMIQKDPAMRPSANDLLNHIFFWNSDKKLKLIQDLSDKLEFQDEQNNILIQRLEEIGMKFMVLHQCGYQWPSVLHPSLIKELQKWRKYNYASFTDLLRVSPSNNFIRNKKNHFRELPDEAKVLLGQTNESYLRYFTINYPNMMIAIDAFVRGFAISDPLFAQYYSSIV